MQHAAGRWLKLWDKHNSWLYLLEWSVVIGSYILEMRMHFLMIPLRWTVLINWSSEYSDRYYYIILHLLDIFKDGFIGIMLAIKLLAEIEI